MTTLNQIRSHSPCTEGWTKLLKHLGKTAADDEPLSLITVLDSNDLDDAIWCLCTEPTPERIQRFALAVARRVEHPQAKATLDVVERYLNGTATKAELDAARWAADAAARAAAWAAAQVADAARAAARAAAWATLAAHAAALAAAAADAAAYAADAAAYAAARGGAADAAVRGGAAADAEREAQSQIFKEMFA